MASTSRRGLTQRALRVRRAASAWSAPGVVRLLLTVEFAAYRLWGSARTPELWPDSFDYRAVSHHGWFTGALWAGARPPLMPVLLKLTGGFDTYAVVVALLGVLAWGFLAHAVALRMEPGWRRTLATAAVLGFASAPLVAQWDWSALSESPALSALAALFACAIGLVDGFTWLRLAGLGAAALAYVGLRDEGIWVTLLAGTTLVGVGALLGATALVGARAALGSGGGTRREGRRPPAFLLAGAALCAVSLAAEMPAAASQRDVANLEWTFAVRVFPFANQVRWFSAHGMPDGREIDLLARAVPPPPPGQAPVVAPDLRANATRDLRAWFEHRALAAYALYLGTHPSYVVLAPFHRPPLTFNNAGGRLEFYRAPGRAVTALEVLFVPDWHVAALVALIAAIVAVIRGVARRRLWWLLVALGLVGLVSMLVAWHGDGQEVTRHMVEGNVTVRLAVLLALLVACLGPPAEPAPRG